jgi:putative tryptophan/tyrosine transport system substrate-binding protein
MIGRRTFIAGLGVAATWPLAARGQSTAMPVVGFLDSRSPEAMVGRLRAFRQGLQETGYVEGENVAIMYRWADNQINRLPELARELVQRRVAVIAAPSETAASAAKATTTTIPIAFVVADDPVSGGLVASLARPGGNTTGINFVSAELVTKRIELLRELVPRAARLAVLVNPAEARRTESTMEAVEAAARAMALEIQVLKSDTSREIENAFESIERERPDALFIATSPLLSVRNAQLAVLAAFHRLPATHSEREFSEAGGLMSYGSNTADAYRQMGFICWSHLEGCQASRLARRAIKPA